MKREQQEIDRLRKEVAKLNAERDIAITGLGPPVRGIKRRMLRWPAEGRWRRTMLAR